MGSGRIMHRDRWGQNKITPARAIGHDNEGSIARVTELGSLVPEAVELGYHLCYGDPGHKHIVEPENLETSVKFSNAICAHAKRAVNWLHMPVPRGRKDAGYFEALQKLDVHPQTEIYLGLLHYTGGVGKCP